MPRLFGGFHLSQYEQGHVGGGFPKSGGVLLGVPTMKICIRRYVTSTYFGNAHLDQCQGSLIVVKSTSVPMNPTCLQVSKPVNLPNP